MKQLAAIFSVLAIAGKLSSGMAGNIDSPGPPSQGSGMYSLVQFYDYLLHGTPLTLQGSFEHPPTGPSSTMKNLREIGDDIKAQFDQCDAMPSDVLAGKKYFCTQAGQWGVQTGTATQGLQGLLKTGQAVESRTGDDGTYQKGIGFSYTDNGDGTVTDNVTGLIWASDGDGAGCANGASLTWEQAVDWSENLSFVGYSDWRLPNIRELESIVSHGVYSPSIDTTFFPNTKIDEYWSATHYIPSNRKWTMHFWNGDMNTHSKYADFRIRAVRAGR